MIGQLVFLWLIFGMMTTLSAWTLLSDELEMALSQEEEDQQPALRAMLTVVGVLMWPLLIIEISRRR